MTPAEMRAWRQRLGITRVQAAEALGMSCAWICSAEIGRRQIGRVVCLACWAIERQRAEQAESPVTGG